MEIEPEIVHIETWDLFTSTLTGESFKQCTSCETIFKNDHPSYLIQKAFERHNPGDTAQLVYEFVLCESCLAVLESDFSIESKEHISRFYSEKVDLDKRATKLLAVVEEEKRLDIRQWTNRCMVTGRPTEELLNYQLLAHGFGHWLAMTSMPCVLSGEAVDELHSSLSQHTTDSCRRFSKDRLDLPPEATRALAVV